MITLGTHPMSWGVPITRVGIDQFLNFFYLPPAGPLRLDADPISPLRRTAQVVGQQIELSLVMIFIVEPDRPLGLSGLP